MTRNAVTSLIVFAFLPISLSGQGFGNALTGTKPKTVSVRRLLPATVNLNGKRIRVEATMAVHSANEDVLVVLKTKLVTAIQRDPRFIIDEDKPETLLHFSVTNYYIEPNRYIVGTGPTQNHCTKYSGKMEVSYQALEAVTGAPLDSENLVYTIAPGEAPKNSTKEKATNGVTGQITKHNPFKEKPKPESCGNSGKDTLHEAQDEMADQIVRQMYQRAAPSEDPIVVPLPGGKLEPVSSLAVSQRWGKLEEDAMNFEKFPKPEDDAYRLYLIALAKEAQAYDLAREAAARENGKEKSISVEEGEASFQRAQKLLDEARKYYKDALTAKDKEKEFREPDDRMEKAILVYATIQRHKEEYQKYLQQKNGGKPPEAPAVISQTVAAPSKLQPPVAPGEAKPPVAADKTPLQQVVAFCQAGVDAGSISDYIKAADFLDDAKKTGYKWDFRTDPISLKQACGDQAAALQKQIRDRLAAAPARTAH